MCIINRTKGILQSRRPEKEAPELPGSLPYGALMALKEKERGLSCLEKPLIFCRRAEKITGYLESASFALFWPAMRPKVV